MNNTVLQQYNLVYAARKIAIYQRKKLGAKDLLRKVVNKLRGKSNVDNYIDNGYYINPICDVAKVLLTS